MNANIILDREGMQLVGIVTVFAEAFHRSSASAAVWRYINRLFYYNTLYSGPETVKTLV